MDLELRNAADLTLRMNSRQKGKRVERLWRDQLREAGFLKAFRGQQYCGAAGNADVVCPELPSMHFEVKGVQNLNVLNAMKQAINDCGEKTPVVAHKKNGEPWLITMLAADWLELVKESDRVVSPDQSSEVAQSEPESLPALPESLPAGAPTPSPDSLSHNTHCPVSEHR